MALAGRTAIVTGGSRGIGREVILALAGQGCNVVVAAKSAEPQPTLPGSIHTVAQEARTLGVEALPYQVDLRDADQISACVDATVERFGGVDILVNNASALWWQDMVDTPIKKYDLITGINSRGTFAMTQACLPHMIKGGFGRVITMSPPITADHRKYAGFTAYNISKFGMTMSALGAAAEGAGHGVTGNSIWPATVIESLASINFKMGDPKTWRKASILSDCVLEIIHESDDFTGNMLIDDTFLLSKGYTQDDLHKYRVDPDTEPLRLLAEHSETGNVVEDFKRGDVRVLETDMTRSKL